VEGSSSNRLRIEYFIVENFEEESQSKTGTVREIQKEPIYSMDLLPSVFFNPTGKETSKMKTQSIFSKYDNMKDTNAHIK